MATLVCAARALALIEESLGQESGDAAARRGAARLLGDSLQLLTDHPLLGQRLSGEIRALAVGYGREGFLLLYRFVVPRDEVWILALRRQREIGYRP